MPGDKIFEEFNEESDREVSTTMVFVRILSKILADKNIGDLVVPDLPDEARTFGMDALLNKLEFMHILVNCRPVDADNLLFYRKQRMAKFLKRVSERIICFIVAAIFTYANHGINTIPFISIILCLDFKNWRYGMVVSFTL